MSGSRVPAISSASSRKRRSGRIIDRATSVVTSSTRISSTRTMMLMMTADRVAEVCSDWPRLMMPFIRELSTVRILPTLAVMF